MKAIERVVKYLDYKGFNNRNFELKVGLSNGYLATQIKRNADLGEGILIKILDNCLDLNPEWLLTGQGDMLRNGLKKESPPDDVFKELDHLRKENAMQTKIIAGLERENELLREKLEDKSVCATQLAPKVVKPSQELALK